MQSGHDFGRAGADHFRREKRRGGVGHSVMNMENIQAFRLAHLSHFDRQRQGVIGAWEDRIGSDHDLMKMNSRQRKIEPDGFGVTKEMHVVTARRQLCAEGRRKNPAAAD
jgi:hypothetical protein